MTHLAHLNIMNHTLTIKLLIFKQPFYPELNKELLCVVFAHPMWWAFFLAAICLKGQIIWPFRRFGRKSRYFSAISARLSQVCTTVSGLRDKLSIPSSISHAAKSS